MSLGGQQRSSPRTMGPNVLLSKNLKTDQRSFFFDIKENQYGVFVSFAETRSGRRRMVSLSPGDFVTFIEFMNRVITGNFTPSPRTPETKDGEKMKFTTLFSSVKSLQRKKIFFDLVENDYGKSIVVKVSRVDGQRDAVSFAEENWEHVYQILKEMSTAYPQFESPLSSPHKVILNKSFDAGVKTILMEFQEREEDHYLKITESKTRLKDSLMLPSVCFAPFSKFLSNLLEGKPEEAVEGMSVGEVDELQGDTRQRTSTTVCKKVMDVDGGSDENSKTFEMEYRTNSHGKFLFCCETSRAVPGNSFPRRTKVFLPEESFSAIIQAIEEFEKIN